MTKKFMKSLLCGLLSLGVIAHPLRINSFGQESHLSASSDDRFEKVIEALGGKEKILEIKGFRASLLFSNYAVRRFIRPKDIEKSEKRLKKQRESAIKRATKKGDETLLEKIKQTPLRDPTIHLAVLKQHHQRLQIELPSRTRNIILNLNTKVSEEGDEVGLDIIDQNGVNRIVVQKKNDEITRKKVDLKQTDVSYSLHFLGLLRSLLASGNFKVMFQGTETQNDLSLEVFLIEVGEGPYAGSWTLKTHEATHLPVILEYRDGLPPFLIDTSITIFSTSEWRIVPHEKKGYDKYKVDVRKNLQLYRQRAKFIQAYGSYRENSGISYPALVKTTIVVPEKKRDNEWNWSVATMSLDWNPSGSYPPLGRDLNRFITENLPSHTQSPPLQPSADSQANLRTLLSIRRFYQQLAWSAIFTANQFYGDQVSSPRYLVISPDWIRFYNLEIKFQEERPLSREDFQ